MVDSCPGGGQGRGVGANLGSGTVGFLHPHPNWERDCLLQPEVVLKFTWGG